MKRRILAVLAYMLPSFPLGYLWHLTLFADRYRELAVFRDVLFVPLGVLSMSIQGIVWALVYEKCFAGRPVLQGALRFGAIACPIAWSYMVLAVAAKHHMASVSGFVAIETAFVIVQYIVVSPLIAAVYAPGGPGRARAA